jgi:hypothetical protein
MNILGVPIFVGEGGRPFEGTGSSDFELLGAPLLVVFRGAGGSGFSSFLSERIVPSLFTRMR